MPDQFHPTLVIGFGGAGVQVVRLLKKYLLDDRHSIDPTIQLLAFDTANDNQDSDSEENGKKLEHGEFYCLGRNLANYVRHTHEKDPSGTFERLGIQELLSKLSISAFDTSKGAGQDRVIGKLALLQELGEQRLLVPVLTEKLRHLRTAQSGDNPLQICFVGSLAGGTGSSWLIDFPVIVRQLTLQQNIRANLWAYIILPEAQLPENRSRITEANAFAAWRELNRLMEASVENPQSFEYPESKPLPKKVVLQQPLYDQCFILQNPDQEKTIYPNAAEVLLSSMYRDFSNDLINKVENRSNKRPLLGAGAYYRGVGIYSVRRPLAELRKYLANTYLLEAMRHEFRISSESAANLTWPPTPNMVFRQGYNDFIQREKLGLGLAELLRGFYVLSEGFNSSSRTPALILDFSTSLVPLLFREITATPSFLTETITGAYLNTDQISNNLSREELLSTAERSRYQLKYRVSGAKSDLSKNEFSVRLSDYLLSLLQEFSGHLEKYINNLTDRDTGDIGILGYEAWLLSGFLEIFNKSHELINIFIASDAQDLKNIVQMRTDRAFENLSTQNYKGGIFRRFSISQAIKTYQSALFQENQFWINYYALQEVLGFLDLLTDLIHELLEQINTVAETFFLGRENLMQDFQTSKSLSFNQFVKTISRLSKATSTEPDRLSQQALSIFKRENLSLKYNVHKLASDSHKLKLNVSLLSGDLDLNLDYMLDSIQQDKFSRGQLSGELQSWAYRVISESEKLNQLYKEVLDYGKLGGTLLEASKPWLAAQEQNSNSWENSFTLMYDPKMFPAALDQPIGTMLAVGNIERNLTTYTVDNTDLVLLQFSAPVTAAEIGSYQIYLQRYYDTYPHYSKYGVNPARHILSAEIAAFRFEDQLANKRGVRPQPLSNSIVHLLQDETLFELFLRALAAEFISTSRNNEGETWYQLSYPELRSEIYLTTPERTSANILLKLPEALSTFILKGQDIRSRYQESAIDYSNLRAQILESYRRKQKPKSDSGEIEEGPFYKQLLASARSLQSSNSSRAFNELMIIIDLIVERWRGISYQTRVVEQKPIRKIFDNYVIAKPLTLLSKNLFVGRQTYFEIIENIWKNQLQKASIILYGQRRMGKTSLLYQLESRLGSNYITVLIDYQGLNAQIGSNADFWRLMAKHVNRKLTEKNILVKEYEDVSLIKSSEGFDDYLYAIEKTLPMDQWLVLMIDEFESIEGKIDAGIIPLDVFDSLRYIIQHRNRIIILLAGHHTLQERMKQYWNPLMETAVNVKLTYLSKEEARQLIRSPWTGFELNYETPALERIIEVCGGQPLLIQLVCKGVINKVNQRLEETGGSLSPTATQSDVDAVLQSMVVPKNHDTDTTTFFFDAIWNWLRTDEKEYLVTLAGIVASQEKRWIDPSDNKVVKDNIEITERLVDRDVLEKDDKGYRFRVDLLKQWIVHHNFK